MISEFAKRIAPRLSAVVVEGTRACANRLCEQRESRWTKLQDHGFHANGEWFCSAACLETEIVRDLVGQTRPMIDPAFAGARLRLGMILLSRGVIGERELRAGLRAQRRGEERIGECLQRLGLVTRRETTAALAAQWRCPALYQSVQLPPEASAVPLTLVREYRAVPVSYSAAGRLMRIAFDGALDHALTYAISHVLDCRTETCITEPASLEEMMAVLAERPRDVEVDFGYMPSAETIARTARSYAEELESAHIRYVSCDEFFWMHISRAKGGVHLVFFRRPQRVSHDQAF
jgi:hypothetical protein